MTIEDPDTGSVAHGTPYADFDHNDNSLSAEQFRQRHDEMRETCPVVHSDRHGGFDVITRYADVRAVLANAEVFSSAEGVFIPQTGMPRTAAMEFDDPQHAMWRTLMGPPLTVRAVRDFEPTIVNIVDHLIDEFAPRGSADLVRDLAEPLPSLVVGRVVGLDHDASLVGREIASRLYASIGSGNFATKLEAFRAFVQAQMDDRRADPRDDFLTQIAEGAVDGVAIDADGATSLLIAYIVGGHHSTGSGIAALFHDVLSDTRLREAVTSDANALARAVDESLRLNTPLQYFARTALAEIDLGVSCIAEQGKVLVDLAAANRDPRQFDRAEEFVLDRRRNPHLAFGAGPHVCLGQHLARAEMRIALGRLLERLPDVTLAGEAAEVVVSGKLLTMKAVPVTFAPR